MLATGIPIEVESEQPLTVGQELAMVRAAFGRNPSPMLRQPLARMLLFDDRFEELIDLLDKAPDLTFYEQFYLVSALLARETPAGDELARAASQRALMLAQADDERATALAMLAKCERRLGAIDQAIGSLREALTLDPHSKDACKRLATIELEADRFDSLLAFTDDLLAKGVRHSRLFGARVLAHARSGDVASARREEGFDQLHASAQLDPPPGWDTIDDFNAALAQELISHPGMRFGRYGSASEMTWRIEYPLRHDTPLFRQLVEQFVKRLDHDIAATATQQHIWTDARPHAARMRVWCVITESTGFETWHVHQFGWLSGVYYVQIPDSITHGTDKGGCLAFGLPEDLVGDEIAARFGERLVRPREGMLLTFPSHVYHRTYPHGTGEKRICVAFDLAPQWQT